MVNKKLIFIISMIFFICIIIRAEGSSLIVAGDNVNVRSEPNNNSQILVKLRIGKGVKLIKRSGKKENINNNEGEWIFIDTDYIKVGESETTKGWVFDYFLLSDFSKFKRITKLKFDKCIFNFEVGDGNSYFEIYQNGTYISKIKDTYLNKEGEKTKGTIYQYKNLILLKNSKGQTEIFFYINEDGYLCNTWFNIQGQPDCSKCKWE